MKKLLLTGGQGFIGSHLLKKLIKKYKVLNIDKLSYASQRPQSKLKNCKLLKIDLKNYIKLEKAFNNFNPDIVVNCAAESHVDNSIKKPMNFIESNIIGTFNLLELSRMSKKKIKFLQVSTDEVFGSLTKKEKKFDELNSYKPKSPYSATKASADHLVRSYGNTFDLNYLITNCSNNYGPYQYPEKLIPVIIFSCIKKEKIPIYGNGKNIRDWIYVEDHVDGIIKVLEKSKPKNTYLIGGNCEKNNLQIANQICKYFNKIDKNFDYRKLIEFIEDRKGHDFRYAINFNKIKKDFNWKPKNDFENGLIKTIKFYLKNYKRMHKLFYKV